MGGKQFPRGCPGYKRGTLKDDKQDAYPNVNVWRNGALKLSMFPGKHSKFFVRLSKGR
jgi:hypothetical protein